MGQFTQQDLYQKKRSLMVEQQIKARGISDENVIRALAEVPREEFVPDHLKKFAYDDGPLSIGEGQTISQPYIVALMTECLEIKNTDRVLEIGTGSGYQTAVLLHIADFVCSIERIPSLAQKAQDKLEALGLASNLKISVGDGSCGLPDDAPFDCIMVTSAAPVIPEVLKGQLSESGRLVVPAGSRHSQTLYKITRKQHSFNYQEITSCVFVPLIGKFGWDVDQG